MYRYEWEEKGYEIYLGTSFETTLGYLISPRVDTV
jgi:hypothetical protein